FALASWEAEKDSILPLRVGPLSTCGYGMDLVRSCYRTKMRWGDTDDTIVDVRWFRVPPGTPCFPVPHHFGSLNWQVGEELDPAGPGEVVGAPRPWFNGATPPWPVPTRHCGADALWIDGIGAGPLTELASTLVGPPDCCAGGPIVTGCCPAGTPMNLFVRFQGGPGDF